MYRRYTIGEFSVLSGTPAKTLRFYDAIGLLRPRHVDPRTMYRFYAAEQLEELVEVLELKNLGLTLTQIANVRAGRVSARDTLRAMREHHEQTILRSSEAIRTIDEQLAGDSSSPHVSLKRRPAAHIVSLRAKVSRYDEIAQMQAFLSAKFEQEWDNNMRGVLWHRCADTGTLEGEAFIEIGAKTSRVRGFEYAQLDAAVVASSYSPDDEAAGEDRYDALREWMRTRGYKLAGPKREIDLSGILDIQFPVTD